MIEIDYSIQYILNSMHGFTPRVYQHVEKHYNFASFHTWLDFDKDCWMGWMANMVLIHIDTCLCVCV